MNYTPYVKETFYKSFLVLNDVFNLPTFHESQYSAGYGEEETVNQHHRNYQNEPSEHHQESV